MNKMLYSFLYQFYRFKNKNHSQMLHPLSTIINPSKTKDDEKSQNISMNYTGKIKLNRTFDPKDLFYAL